MGTRVDTFVPSLLLTVDALRPALSSFCFLESMKWCTMTWNCGPSSTFALLICPRQCLSQQQGITLSHVAALLNSCSIKKFKDTTGLSSEFHSTNPHGFSLKTWALYYKEPHTLSSVYCCQVKTSYPILSGWLTCILNKHTKLSRMRIHVWTWGIFTTNLKIPGFLIFKKRKLFGDTKRMLLREC